MQKIGLVVLTLRAALIAAFALLLVFQTMSMPGQFAHMTKENPDIAYMRWPLTIFSILLLGCIQVVVVSTWKLLTMVKQNRIFSTPALRWVDAILWAIATAWLMTLSAFFYIAINGDDPGVPMLLMLMLVGGAVLGLLIVVMRALLLQATTLTSDMEAVI